MNKIQYLVIFILIIVSCSRNNKRQELTTEEIQAFNEKSVEVNRQLVLRLQDTIKDFIAKNNWNMKKTGTGLWYAYTRNGNTDTIKKGDIVAIDYTVSLINGKLCYSSDSLGPKIFKVGQGGVESGLEEAVLQMCTGDSARLIIPPHLAHGLIGDQNKIPKLAILNYTVVIKKHDRPH